jgi:hypothetical protein
VTETFVSVKRPKSGVGRQCMHCGRPATVKATRVARYGKNSVRRLPVRYCDEHAELRGV